MTTCHQCGEAKPIDAFRLRKSVTTGLHYRGKVCRACHQAKGLAWRKRNPDRVRVYNSTNKAKDPKGHSRRALISHFARKYGLTLAQRDAMLVAQGGACLICKTDAPKGKGWCVDHDHTTGALRGILCAPCNAFLGLAKDDTTILQAAIDYLERYK